MTPPKLTDSKLKWLWSEAHNDTTERMPAEVFARAIESARDAQWEAMLKQGPVKFLANGTRFKTSVFPYGVCINGLPKDLAGRWVALVAAEDDCHLKLAAPQPAQQERPTLPFNDELEAKLGYRLPNFGFDAVRELMVDYAEKCGAFPWATGEQK